MYEGWERDVAEARAAFVWKGGAEYLVDEWERVPGVTGLTHERHFAPDGYSQEETPPAWVWRYGVAAAGTGSSYRVLVTKVHPDVADREGGPVIVTVTSPWQDSWAFAEGGYIDESYVAEHLTGGRWRDGRLHGGDLAALTMLIRLLLGRTEHDPILSVAEGRKDA